MRLKHILLLIVCIIIAFSQQVFAVNADIMGTKYEKAVETLKSLHIMYDTQDGTFQPDEEVSRAEMVVTLMRAMGLAEVTLPIAEEVPYSRFKDVPKNHWAVEDINMAADMKLISGTTKDTFEPDKAVTYEQAVKLIVNMLGYNQAAEAKGGYPEGYILVAGEKGITNGAAVEIGKQVTRGNVALLLYNSLDAERIKQVKASH